MKCFNRRIACQYVESEAHQARRKYEDLRKRRSAHEELLSLLRTLPEQDAVGLFHRIRDRGDVGIVILSTQITTSFFFDASAT